MSLHILITGASGLVGKTLTQMLIQKGHTVATLGRTTRTDGGVKSYTWDIEKNYIDTAALEKVDGIIHLAGAGIADKRWTEERKKEIIESRINGIRLLAKAIEKKEKKPLFFISASAIGYYGADRGNELLTEKAALGNDFLAEVCQKWEAEAQAISALGLRVCSLRIGIVLSAQGGALPKLAMPVIAYAGAYLGNGNQWVSWIHLHDLCRMFIAATEDTQMNGVYNAVAPNPVTHQVLIKTIAKQLKRPVWPLYIPAFLLKIVLGEMAVAITGSVMVSCVKVLDTGFAFEFRTIDQAISSVYA